MKKFLVFSIVVGILGMLCGLICFAQFDYSSFPTVYSFNYSQTYTAYDGSSAIFDGAYVKGTNGFLGIGRVYTSNTLTINGIPYYYTSGKLVIESGSSEKYVQTSFPTTPGDIREIQGTLDVTSAATLLQYDVDVFQISNNQIVNKTKYFYSTEFGMGLEINP
jgi:hypothetical protein